MENEVKATIFYWISKGVVIMKLQNNKNQISNEYYGTKKKLSENRYIQYNF